MLPLLAFARHPFIPGFDAGRRLHMHKCEAMSEPSKEVRALVAAFLVTPEDLLEARVFHPDVWRGTDPGGFQLIPLLTACPASECKELMTLFECSHPMHVMQCKGWRGFPVPETTPDYLLWQYFLGVCAGGHVDILQTLRCLQNIENSHAQQYRGLYYHYALQSAAEGGHVPVIVELRTHWGLTTRHALFGATSPVDQAIASQHINVIDEFVQQWDVPLQTVQELMTKREMNLTNIV